MIDLQIKNTDDSNGLKRGIHYLPFIPLIRTLQTGLAKRSDGTTDADGILYPNTINNTSGIGSVNSFIGGITGISAPSTNDEMFTNNQTKVFVGLEWFSKYKRLINAALMTGLKGRQNAVPNSIDSNSGPFKLITLDSTRAVLLYKPGGTGLYAIVLKRGTGDAITYGTPFAIHGSNVGMSKQNVDGVLINTDKVFVVNSCNGEGRVLSISDTTITMGSAASGFVYHAGSGIDCSLTKLDTDKVVVVYYDNNANASYAKCATVSGTTITAGSEVNIGNNHNTPIVLGNGTGDAFVVMSLSGGTKGRVLTVSGTTINPEASADVLVTGTINAKHRYVKLASNKFLVLSSTDKAVVITVSGTGFSVVSNNLTTGMISVDGNTSYGAILEITTNTTYQLYEGVGDGSTLRTRYLTISGTTVTDGTAEVISYDGGYMSYTVAAIWGSAIGIVSLNNSQNQMMAYLAAAGPTTYEIYNDTTIIGGTRTDNFSFVAKTLTIDGNINAKRFYFGIKNTSGATRYITLTTALVEVK